MKTRTPHHRLPLAALTLGLILALPAKAALHDRGGGLIYDDVLNITWLADANYGAGSTYDNGSITTDGRMTWANAVAWAENLIYHDNVRNVDYSDWRLPTMVDTGVTSGCASLARSDTDCGRNVQTVNAGTVYSEMAHMYFNNLGLKSDISPMGAYQADFGIFGNGTYNGTDSSSFGQNDVGLIDNLQAYVYWSGLEYAPVPDQQAWGFFTYDGFQYASNKTNYNYAWAVRTGDVAAVPEADTWAMLLAGLGLVGMARRRRRE